MKGVSMIALTLATVSASMLLGSGPAQAEGRAQTGQELYEQACAGCHGVDGTGARASLVAFDTPLPDFTDCSFATREPDVDWVAVTHDGGPARAFARMMPAFGEALTVEQIQKTMDYVRGFCADEAWPRGELNLPRPMFTEKAYVEDEAVFTLGSPLEGTSGLDGELLYEKRFGARNQLEVVVPFGLRDIEDDGWAEGLGDVAVGVKRAVFHSLASGSIFSVAGEVILPSGDESEGFGSGTFKFEPFLAYGQLLPAKFFVHLQGGVELPLDTDLAEREGFWRGALGRTFTFGRWGRVVSPMVELLGGRELSSAEDVRTSWDIVPQVQVSLNQRQNILASVALRQPLTDADARPTELYFYVLWDWFDGGFFEGW